MDSKVKAGESLQDTYRLTLNFKGNEKSDRSLDGMGWVGMGRDEQQSNKECHNMIIMIFSASSSCYIRKEQLRNATTTSLPFVSMCCLVVATKNNKNNNTLVS